MQTLTHKEFGDIVVNNVVNYEYGNIRIMPVDSYHFSLAAEDNSIEASYLLGMSIHDIFNMNLLVLKSGNKILIIKNRHMGLTGQFTLVE